MSLYPIFAVRMLLLLVLPVFLAAVILAAAGKRGISVFKKQGVAWVITGVMIVVAIGIGSAKANASRTPESVPAPPQTIPPGYSETIPPAFGGSFVWDNARVLSDQTVWMLNQCNDRLWDNYSVTVGVVTCDYGGDDLYGYAMQCAEDMGLGGYDMIVVLDISGDSYWLLQGNDIRRNFTDNDCSDYAYDYMEEPFARGDYDSAVLDLTEALEGWYGVYYY